MFEICHLSYGKKTTIRAVIDDGNVWLPASDLYLASKRYTDRRLLSHFAPEHLKLLPFPSLDGTQRLTCVSPNGAVTIAESFGHPLRLILSAWLRREVGSLADKLGTPRLSFGLLADGTMPARPRVDHEDYCPWNALDLRRPHYRLPANPAAPALQDDDTNLPPEDMEAVAPRVSRPFFATLSPGQPLPN